MSATAWQVQGRYYENCNCDFVCPCLPGQMMVKPTKGTCIFAMAFQIERGNFGQVPLDGLGFVVVGVTPEEMAKGNWSVGVVVDERASAEQREAITGIASGAAGGPMAAVSGLVGKFLGVESSPIAFSDGGRLLVGERREQDSPDGPARHRPQSGRRPPAAVEHGASRRRHVQPRTPFRQPGGRARRRVGGCRRPQQRPVRPLRLAQRVGGASKALRRRRTPVSASPSTAPWRAAPHRSPSPSARRMARISPRAPRA